MPTHRTKENQEIVATESRHTVGEGAGEKKEKAPQEKSPQQKKRNRCLRLRLLTGGCAALLSRFFSLFLRRLRRLLFLPSPRFSLLLWAAAPPLLFASPLALLSGGCAASLSPALSWAAGAAPSPLSYTMKSRLSETHMGIGVPLSPDCENQRFSCQGLLRLSLSEACFVTVTSHKLFFFSLFRFINQCVDVLGYTDLNFKAFGHKFLSFGKFFLLIRKKFVSL